MTVPYELVGIATSTVGTLPVYCAWLAADPAGLPFLSPQFGCHLGFQKLLQNGLNGISCGSFRLFLYHLQHLLALLTL
jgi:hypothetical protein